MSSFENFLNYDIAKMKINNKLINAHFIKINDDEIIFYNFEKKLIFKSKFEIQNIFVYKFFIWIWSWAMPTLSKNEITMSRSLLNYYLDLPSDDAEKIFFITSRFKLPNKLYIDHINSCSMNILKNKSIYELKLKISKCEIENHADNLFTPITFKKYFKKDVFINVADEITENVDDWISFFIIIDA